MTDGARNTIPKGNNSASLNTGIEPLVAQLWVNYQSIKRKCSMKTQSKLSTFNFESNSIRTFEKLCEEWILHKNYKNT